MKIQLKRHNSRRRADDDLGILCRIGLTFCQPWLTFCVHTHWAKSNHLINYSFEPFSGFCWWQQFCFTLFLVMCGNFRPAISGEARARNTHRIIFQLTSRFYFCFQVFFTHHLTPNLSKSNTSFRGWEPKRNLFIYFSRSSENVSTLTAHNFFSLSLSNMFSVRHLCLFF